MINLISHQNCDIFPRGISSYFRLVGVVQRSRSSLILLILSGISSQHEYTKIQKKLSQFRKKSFEFPTPRLILLCPSPLVSAFAAETAEAPQDETEPSPLRSVPIADVDELFVSDFLHFIQPASDPNAPANIPSPLPK